MIIDKLSIPSKEYNEDGYIIDDDFIMVIDGATSLEKNNLLPSAGAYLVNKIVSDLPKKKGDIILRLNTISKEIYSLLNNNGSLNNKMLPSAGIAWIEIQANDIIVHTIGDCEVVLVNKEGFVKRVVIEDLAKFDNIAIDEMIKVSKNKNISIKEARQYINDTLINNRMMMNKENGYAIFTPSSDPNFKYSTTIFNKEDIKEIYIYSDGFADAFETFKLYDSADVMFSNSVDINEVVNDIIDTANKDELYNKYPRFKLIDDITVVKIIM